MDSFVTQKAEFIFSNTTSMPKNEDISLNYLQVIVFLCMVCVQAFILGYKFLMIFLKESFQMHINQAMF